MQLPYFCATAFSSEGLFLDMPFPLKLLSSRSLLCLFADRFEDEFASSRRDFCFSADGKDLRGSSYCRFFLATTFRITTGISRRNTVRDGNQKKILRMYPPYLFVTHISCRSYGLTVKYFKSVRIRF